MVTTRPRRRSAAPIEKKPISIIAQVAGSGTPPGGVTGGVTGGVQQPPPLPPPPLVSGGMNGTIGPGPGPTGGLMISVGGT